MRTGLQRQIPCYRENYREFYAIMSARAFFVSNQRVNSVICDQIPYQLNREFSKAFHFSDTCGVWITMGIFGNRRAKV